MAKPRKSWGEQLADALQQAADDAAADADAHGARAAEHSERATGAHIWALIHDGLGYLGVDGSAARAEASRDRRDAHTATAGGHTTSEAVSRLASSSLGWLAAAVREAAQARAAQGAPRELTAGEAAEDEVS